MQLLFILLGLAASIASLVCWVIILIDAFQESLMKGLLCLFCCFYGFYYALFDFEHDNKWLIVIGAFGGGSVSAGLMRLSGN
ncbi:hypothetical protein EON81_05165 [bacterium]|nr:MAG: hypothetical protein EON81_05165 [bacterium]